MRTVLAALAALIAMGMASVALSQPRAAAAFDPQAYAENKYGRLFGVSGRYMEMGGACAEPTLNYPGYPGLPVLNCQYRFQGVTGDVWMLNADATRLARWSVSACRAIETRHMRACLDRVVERVWGGSNGMFPIAGFVVQPGREVGGQSDAPYCSLVRHGVTVSVQGWRTRPARNGQCGSRDLMDDPVTAAGMFARPASVTRANLRAAGVTDDMSGAKFADVVGRLFREAWNADDNVLITAWAKAARRSGALR